MKYLTVLGIIGLLGTLTTVRAADPPKDKPDEQAKQVAAAREKGLDWLSKNQANDGSWGKTYTIAVTSFVCLTYLSAADEPFTGDRGAALVKGLQFLMNNQKDGMFAQQGHSWIHGQGFGTLALAEAYGRSLLCKTKPDIDMKKVRAAVAQSVKHIAKNQSTNGGWWYTPGAPGQSEGSTTVCAVQALVAAANFGVEIDQKVLDTGFEYLKKCQNKDGSFQYQLGDNRHMKEGTCGDVATLGLMQQFDNQVMLKGYKFLQETTPAGVCGDFAEYGAFYGCMGMMLLGQEFKDDKEFREKTAEFIAGIQKVLLGWQGNDGTWPLRGWIASSGETTSFSTAWSTLTLYVPEARLSIYNRTPPTLPKEK